MRRIFLAMSVLAIAGAGALTSANESQGAYAGECRVIRERIDTRRTGQPLRLRVVMAAAISLRANADARRNKGAAYGFRALAAVPEPLSQSAPMSSPRPASDAGQSGSQCRYLPCE